MVCARCEFTNYFWGFVVGQNVRSNQDDILACTNGDFIVLPQWNTVPTVLWHTGRGGWISKPRTRLGCGSSGVQFLVESNQLLKNLYLSLPSQVLGITRIGKGHPPPLHHDPVQISLFDIINELLLLLIWSVSCGSKASVFVAQKRSIFLISWSTI